MSIATVVGAIAASAEMSGTFAISAIVIKLITDEYDRRTLKQGKALPAAAGQKKKARSATSNTSAATERATLLPNAG